MLCQRSSYAGVLTPLPLGAPPKIILVHAGFTSTVVQRPETARTPTAARFRIVEGIPTP